MAPRRVEAWSHAHCACVPACLCVSARPLPEHAPLQELAPTNRRHPLPTVVARATTIATRRQPSPTVANRCTSHRGPLGCLPNCVACAPLPPRQHTSRRRCTHAPLSTPAA
eukprot:93100-Chlamydomonas_euryale.AAC.1